MIPSLTCSVHRSCLATIFYRVFPASSPNETEVSLPVLVVAERSGDAAGSRCRTLAMDAMRRPSDPICGRRGGSATPLAEENHQCLLMKRFRGKVRMLRHMPIRR